MRIILELDMRTNIFVAFEHENQRLLGDLQHVTTEKAQQYEELSQRVHQLEATILLLREKRQGLRIPLENQRLASLPNLMVQDLCFKAFLIKYAW